MYLHLMIALLVKYKNPLKPILSEAEASKAQVTLNEVDSFKCYISTEMLPQLLMHSSVEWDVGFGPFRFGECSSHTHHYS